MTFEPTFDDIEAKSAELPDVAGDVEDVELDDIDRDLAGGSDASSDVDAIEDVGEAEADTAPLAGNVTAADLPPYGDR